MNEQHVTKVEEETDNQYRAVCSCKWKSGKLFTSYYEATVGGWAHRMAKGVYESPEDPDNC